MTKIKKDNRIYINRYYQFFKSRQEIDCLRRVILYITNPKRSHRCYTFLFNLRQYIINFENNNSKTPSEDVLEIPGYYQFNPFNLATKYETLDTKHGTLEFQHNTCVG